MIKHNVAQRQTRNDCLEMLNSFSLKLLIFIKLKSSLSCKWDVFDGTTVV
ncbi:unnamed protein product [Schistosoma mattheei]|uniref:Uncharacterized protein n=2 Tax=Schistosoma TaxID=6181 RepID=A0A183KBN6_9TREM|nr:unnamed protein product [Schistosoma curassoni]VDP58252.1 unnamed protein product [Schistosoma mattheei]